MTRPLQTVNRPASTREAVQKLRAQGQAKAPRSKQQHTNRGSGSNTKSY